MFCSIMCLIKMLSRSACYLILGLHVCCSITWAATASTSTNSNETSPLSSLVYNASLSTWERARDYCLSAGGSLPVLELSNKIHIEEVRDIIGSKQNSDVWTGNYKTYDVINEDQTVKSKDVLCVTASFTKLTAFETATEYGFNLTATNCSRRLTIICRCFTGVDNSSNLYITNGIQTSWLSANATCRNHNSRCSLWRPKLELYNKQRGHVIGLASVLLGGSSVHLAFRHSYWINLRIKERFGPVLSNISKEAEPDPLLECGYISNTSNGVRYGPCDDRKSFMCVKDKTISQNNPQERNGEENNDKGSPSAGVYVGIIAAASVSVIGVAGVIVWRVKFKSRSHDNRHNNLPRGGRSFRPAPPGEESPPDPQDVPIYATAKRKTLPADSYAQINPEYLQKNKTPSTSIRPVPYATTKLYDNTVHVVQEIGIPGYLRMDGHKDSDPRALNNTESDNAYDSIRNSAVVDNFEFENRNVYGTASESDVNSVYNSTIDRHSSRRNLVDYDHVVLNREDSTTNRAESSTDNENYE